MFEIIIRVGTRMEIKPLISFIVGTRPEAIKLCDEDNKIKYDTLKNFSDVIGFNLDNVLSKISSLDKLY